MTSRVYFLPAKNTWVGPPVLIFRDRVLDGSKRLDEWKRRGFDGEPPTYSESSAAMALLALIEAGHYDRAAKEALKIAPHLISDSTSTLAAYWPDLDRRKMQAFIRAQKPPSARGVADKRAMAVVKRLIRLRNRYLEGDTELSLEDLNQVLGPFGA